MNVFALIGRIAFAKESTTMAQKKIGEMHQSVCRKDPESTSRPRDPVPGTMSQQLAAIEEIEALLKTAQHNISIVKQDLLEELNQ